MTIDKAVEEYLANLRRKGYSAKTINAYAFDLDKFVKYLNETIEIRTCETAVNDIDKKIVQGWIDYYLEKGNKPRTIARKIATCKSLFKHLEKEEIIKENPITNVSLPRISKKPPAALSQDEIRQILAAPDPENKNFLRDRAILLLLYSAGLRVSELISLKREQIMMDRQSIRIHGKGSKDRILPLADTTRKAINDYFLERDKILPNSHDPRSPAFVTPSNKPMTVRMVQYMVHRYGLDAGIPFHVYPHLIRHSIATHLIEEGCNVEAVRQTLGHEDLATTSIYLKASSKYLRDEHKKFNPTDNLLK